MLNAIRLVRAMALPVLSCGYKPFSLRLEPAHAQRIVVAITDPGDQGLITQAAYPFFREILTRIVSFNSDSRMLPSVSEMTYKFEMRASLKQNAGPRAPSDALLTSFVWSRR